MKKTNFVVIFWLILAIISFVFFWLSLISFLESISCLLFPDSNSAYTYFKARDIIVAAPLLIFAIISFTITLKQGLKIYNSDTNTEK